MLAGQLGTWVWEAGSTLAVWGELGDLWGSSVILVKFLHTLWALGAWVVIVVIAFGYSCKW